ADLDPRSTTSDAGQPSAPEGENGSDASVRSRDAGNSDDDDGTSEPTTSSEGNSAVPTQGIPTSTAPDETSILDETSGTAPVPIEGPDGRTNCTEVREESEDGCRYVLACDY